MRKLIICLVMVLSINTFSVFGQDLQFSDVSASHWALENINKLVSLGVINGYPDLTFRPDNSINVDAFIKLAVTALGYTTIENSTPYWAQNYINKALQLGLIDDGQFDTYTRSIIREEMASIIIKAYGMKEERADIEKDIPFIRNIIQDYFNISDYYKQEVCESYKYGLITGKPNGFDPKGKSTRAEASTVIIRLLDETYRKHIYIPPTVEGSDIKVDEDGKMYFDVLRYRDYKNEDERIAKEVKKTYRVYECSDGEITALQLMHAMDKVYQDNEGYVHLGQLGKDNHPIGVGYYCLDNIEQSYDVVDQVSHSEVTFAVKHSKHESSSAYGISFYYKTHDMTYMERFYKYEKMFDTIILYLYEDKFQVAKERIIEILQLAENMEIDQYQYTIKLNDRDMYVEINQNHSVRFYSTIKGGKVEHYNPIEENEPCIPCQNKKVEN